MSNTTEAAQENHATHAVIDALYDLPLGGHWSEVQAALCGFWSATEQEPADHDIDRLERHFERALSFLQRLPAEEHRWRVELYRMPVAAFVCNRRGEMIDCNNAAGAILGIPQDGELNATGQTCIRNAINHLQAPALASATLPNTNGDELRLYITALSQPNEGGDALYLAAIVTRELPEHALTLLSDQYRLTPSEARLCVQLSAGASLEDLAASADIKKSTLRTHLSSCFAKMQVKSQPELVAVALQNIFAGAHLNTGANAPPTLTAHLDPELHGYPKFSHHILPDGRVLGFFEYGDPDGIPAIYLHGSLDSGLIMKTQKLTGSGIRLLAVERGGVGESTPNNDPSPEAYARDIAHLASALELPAYAVIGRSMGCWDAVSVVQADPLRARLLVMTGGRLPVERSEQHLNHDPFFRALYNAIWQSDTMGKLMLRVMLVQLMVRGPQYFIKFDELPPLEQALVSDPLHLRHLKASWLRSAQGGAEPVHQHLRLYREPVNNPPWRNLETPTLLLHGEDDNVVPVELLLDQTQTFRNRQVVVFPGLGHRMVNAALGEALHRTARAWKNL